jgi:hypothetical protein
MFRIWGNCEYVDVYIYEEIECCSVPDTHTHIYTDIRFLPRSVNLLLEFVAVLYSLYMYKNGRTIFADFMLTRNLHVNSAYLT